MPTSTAIRATYRLQFNKDFTFQDATKLLDYLSELGITHVYASPIFRSRPGSTHGYDVIDPTRLNSELGTEADFEALHEGLQQRGMGLLLDIVPNHMSASNENSWWMDVLENGPDSAYAAYFDIDWHPPARNLEGKVLLPVLGRPFGEALEKQELKLAYSEGRFFVQYFESLFPLAPATYRRILRHRIDQLKERIGEHSTPYHEYLGIVAAVSALSERDATKAEAAGEKRLEFEAVRERLRQLLSANAQMQAFVQENLTTLEGEPRDAASFSALERLLDEQHYVLAYWQNANAEINYRRFFTITDLVGMRVQDPLVFDATHALVARLVEQNIVSGLRIDHIDGLRDPLGYLNRLKERLALPESSGDLEHGPIFVEKILGWKEHLRFDWPVAGTTGYDFLNALNCFFVHPRGFKRLEDIYFKFLGKTLVYDEVLYQKKRLVMALLLGVEMRALGHHLGMLATHDRYARDIAITELSVALVEVTAHLPVYRTYIRNLEVASEDEKLIEEAIGGTRTRKPQLDRAALDFVRDVLLLRNRPHLLPDQREERLAFVMRWQQSTGPIMAKAFEDTFLYVYNPLISLNEVAGAPLASAVSASNFPAFIKERSKHWPISMNATTTHDTKRAEDVRARINVLSEIPAEWEYHLEKWAKLNLAHKRVVKGVPVPDRNEEIFLYQTLLGSWPLDAGEFGDVLERLQAYAIKATREAMVHTRWTLPNLPHERAIQRFLEKILKPGKKNAFLPSFLSFQERTAYYGMINGLSQTLLKIVSPGIPDFYQGSELWDLRLVDPDNRQPVDFAKRSAMLRRLQETMQPQTADLARELTRTWRDGRIKLFLIWKALNFRREHYGLFSKGDFARAAARGRRKENAAAFVRRHKSEWLLAVVPQWLAATGAEAVVAAQGQFWGDTEIRLPGSAAESWSNVFTGEEVVSTAIKGNRSIKVSQLLKDFPVALLRGNKASQPQHA